MTARIAWLSASLALLLIGAAHIVLPARVIVVRATQLLGADPTLAAAVQGHYTLGRQLLLAELIAAAPWLAAGAMFALALHAALRRWQNDVRPSSYRPIIDVAGVALTLRDEAFDHATAPEWLPMAPMPATRLPRGATELERQAFAALAAAAAVPVDARRPGLSVQQRAQRRYDIAVRLYGAGSLAAIGAVVCELGWLLALEQREGRWVEVHDSPERLSLHALARLPACWQLDPAERARISALIDHACHRRSPLGAEPEVRVALAALARLHELGDLPVGAVVSRTAGGVRVVAPPPPVRDASSAGCIAMLVLACLFAWQPPARAQDAPLSRPRSAAMPPQRVGDIIVDAAVMPVWTVPAVEPDGMRRLGQAVSDPALLSRLPPPAPRRRGVVSYLEGAFDRPEWRAIVTAGQGVPLAAAVVRIAPPGLRPSGFEGIESASLQAPVSWSAGLDRATALESVLRANGLRAVVSDAGIVLTQAPQSTAAIVDDAAAWRRRAAELEAAAQEARRAEIATLAREREQLEARRRAAELELKSVELASEKLQQEHRSRLADTATAFIDREWKLSPDDSTLRHGLARWARLEGVGFAWEADYDLPVVAELAYRGPLPTVIERLMQKVPPDSKLIYSLDRLQGLVVRAAPRS